MIKNDKYRELKVLHQNKPKILMVDDRDENLLALERLLEDLPVLLYKANSGNEALKLTLHHNFALALLDIQMPDMDGYELAEILRQEEKTANLPFIFISAIYTDSANIFKGYRKGAFSYITKPFEPEVLLSKVRFFIDKYRQELELNIKSEELQRSNEELESFSYSVSHDLRAPLRAIDGYASILLEDYYDKLDDDGQRFLSIVKDEATRMGNLIDDLLSFSRLNRKEQIIEPVDMKKLADHVMDKIRDAHKGLNINYNCSSLHEVCGDKSLLQQVWVNLLGNAVKYRAADQEPKINVTSKLDKATEQVVFSVEDKGVGFNTKYADKLFGVFQRLHRDDEFEGTGIGLALVRRIVNRHGGDVWAESELGKGSTFYFSLPILKQQITSDNHA